MSGELTYPVVFFDGTCGFCDRSVTFLFARDRRHVLRFAPLQGKAARRWLSDRQIGDLDTMVLLDGGRTYEQSDAALRAVRAVGGGWGLLGSLALLVPRVIRNFCYGIIARHRYRIFGKSAACRLPSAAERAFFLD